MEKVTGYDLSRAWFNWSFENPEKINPGHTAIFFFAIEHCNRMGWKEKFGFPSRMVMDAIGIRKHGTYIKYFNDLCAWGFFNLVEKSTNQYSANIISLKNAMPKNGKALDKAMVKHGIKHGHSMGQSKVHIDKQVTINNKPITKENNFDLFILEFNLITNKKFKGSANAEKQFNARNDKFTIEEMLLATKNCFKDSYHQQNPQYLTPDFILRQDKLEKYLNATPEKIKPSFINQDNQW